jgi:hypothetical protein
MTRQERGHTMGSGGQCVCPKCESSVPHRPGFRCQDERCPQCGAKMLRVGSRHHELWLARRKSGHQSPLPE